MRATMEMERLKMKDTHQVARFTMEFLTLSSELNWGDEALEYYRSLAPRIHSQMALVSRK